MELPPEIVKGLLRRVTPPTPQWALDTIAPEHRPEWFDRVEQPPLFVQLHIEGCDTCKAAAGSSGSLCFLGTKLVTHQQWYIDFKRNLQRRAIELATDPDRVASRTASLRSRIDSPITGPGSLELRDGLRKSLSDLASDEGLARAFATIEEPSSLQRHVAQCSACQGADVNGVGLCSTGNALAETYDKIHSW